MEEIEQVRHHEPDDLFISDICFEVGSEMELTSSGQESEEMMNASYLSIFSNDSHLTTPMDLSPFSSPRQTCILSPTKLMAESSDDSIFNLSYDVHLKDECSSHSESFHEISNLTANEAKRIEFRLTGHSLGCLQKLPQTTNSDEFKLHHTEFRRVLINKNIINRKRPDLARSISEYACVGSKNCKILPKINSEPFGVKDTKSQNLQNNLIDFANYRGTKNCRILPKNTLIAPGITPSNGESNILSKNMAIRNLFSDTSNSATSKQKDRSCFTSLINGYNKLKNIATETYFVSDSKFTPERRLSMPLDANRTTSPTILRRRRTLSKANTEIYKFKDNLKSVESPPTKIMTFSVGKDIKVVASTPKRIPVKSFMITPEKIKFESNNSINFDYLENPNYLVSTPNLKPNSNNNAEQTLNDIKIAIETPSKNLISEENFCLSPLMLSFSEDDVIKNSTDDNDDDVDLTDNVHNNDDYNENDDDISVKLEDSNEDNSFKKIACGNTRASQTLVGLARMYIRSKNENLQKLSPSS